MKKQLSAAIMAAMLVLQVMVSSVVMPINAAAATNTPLTENSSTASDIDTTNNTNNQSEDLLGESNDSQKTEGTDLNTDEAKVQEPAATNEESKDAIKEEQTTETLNKEIVAEDKPSEEEEPKSEEPKATKKALTKSAVANEKTAPPASIVNTLEMAINGKPLAADQVTKVELGQLFSLNYGLAIPLDTFKAGDTYTIDLPGNFNSDGIDGGTINELGTYKVKDGQIIITFSKEVENENGTLEIDGNEYLQAGITLTSELQANETTNIVQNVVVTTIKGQETYELQFKPQNVNNNLDKTGVIGKLKEDGTINDKSKNPDVIQWTVTFNKDKAVLNNAIFKDTFDTNKLTLDEDSFKVTELIVALDGKVTDGGDVTADFTKQADNSWKIKEGSDKAYKITYTTLIKDNAATSYSNKASVTATGLSKTATKTLNVTRQAFMTKYGNTTALGANWTINYNYSLEELTNEVMTDTLSNTQVFDKSSVQIFPVTFNANGDAQVGGTAIAASMYDVVFTETNQMKITFKDTVTTAYQIRYNSSLVDRIVDKNRETTNTVTANGNTVVAKVTHYPNTIGKGHNEVDFQKRTVKWTITVNTAGYTMNNALVRDVFQNANLTYIEGSATVDGLSFTPTLTANGLNFDLGTISKRVVITYKTNLDTSTKSNFLNVAHLDWNNNYSSTTQSTLGLPKDVNMNGFKDGSYQWNAALQNYVFNWRVGFNLNLQGVDEGQTIVDEFLTENMTLTPGSLKIIVANMESGIAAETSAVLDPSFYSVTEKDNGFTVTFLKDLPANQAFIMKYSTTDSDQVFEQNYSNVAKSSLFGPNPDKAKFTKELKVPNGGNGIEKTGTQVGKSRTFNYQVNINKANSILPNAVVTDTLSSATASPEDMKYVVDSFKLSAASNDVQIPLILTTNPNQLPDTAYYLYFNEQQNSFKVIFPANIDKAYKLSYQVYFEGDKNSFFKNSAVLNFNGDVTSITHSKITDIQYKNNSSTAGWGTVIYKDLYVKKVDAQTGRALQGAVFELYKTDDLEKVYRTATTDENGLLKFVDIRLKETGNSPYVLKEVKAPANYMISDAYKAGKLVEFSKTNSVVETAYQVANEHAACELTIQFKDANDKENVSANGTYQVYVEKDGEKVPYKDTKVTFKDGQASVELAPGEYFLKQDGKIEGFTSAKEFTAISVEYDENGICSTTVAIVELVPVCDVVILNVDKDSQQKIQNGAEFTVFQDGKEIKTVTSKNGEIVLGQLPSGDYELVQKTAPNGYVKNTEAIEFTVDAENCATVLPKFENEVPKCDITVINKDENGDIITDGSEYKVVQNGKTIIENVKAENGQIILPNLPAGDYELVQTKVDGMYTLNTTPVEFTVDPTNCEATVEVTNDFAKCEITVMNKDEYGDIITDGSEYKVVQNGKTIIENVKAKDGQIIIPALKKGDYELVQTKVSEQYVLNTTPVEFTVDPTQCATQVIVTNDFAKCDVTVINKDVDGDVITSTSTYDVYAIVDGEKVKVNKDPLTAVDGKIIIPQLKSGDYELVQTSVEGNYVVNEEPVTFTVDPTNCETVVIVNDFGKCEVTIINKDGDTNDVITAGSEYKLYKKDENGDKKEIVVEGGIKAGTNGEIVIPGLERGDYVLEQVTAPEHYEKAAPIDFTVNAKDCSVVTPIVLENTMTYCPATIVLIDEELAQGIEGAEFIIKDVDGNKVGENVTFGKDGKIVTDPLRPGTYTLELVKDVAGYDIAKTTTFVINPENCGATIEINITNTPNKCDVTFINKDSFGNVITAESTYKVEKVNADGSTTVITENIKSVDGKIIVEQLRPGNYVLTQTEAPIGYFLQDKPQPFEVLKDDCLPELTIENIACDFTILYVGPKDSNASFTLYDVTTDRIVVAENIKVVDGKLQMPTMKPGNYELVQTTVPKGFEATQPVQFTVEPGACYATPITVENSDLPVVLPTPLDPKPNKPVEPPTIDEPVVTGKKPNTEYQVIDKETGKVIYTGKTTEQGELKLKNTPKNPYKVVEITYGNEELPQTGETNPLFASVAGLLALALGAYVLVRNRRVNKA